VRAGNRLQVRSRHPQIYSEVPGSYFFSPIDKSTPGCHLAAIMADLELALSWLGMTHYHERFVQAGFDTWEVVLEITEEDLEAR